MIYRWLFKGHDESEYTVEEYLESTKDYNDQCIIAHLAK